MLNNKSDLTQYVSSGEQQQAKIQDLCQQINSGLSVLHGTHKLVDDALGAIWAFTDANVHSEKLKTWVKEQLNNISDGAKLGIQLAIGAGRGCAHYCPRSAKRLLLK
jgi:hypothetical protein